MEVHTFPRTVDEIYEDFLQRRYGLQRALTDGEAGSPGGGRPVPGARVVAGAARPEPAAAARARAGAATTPALSLADADALFEKCDPARENLCLYGGPRGGGG
jgi:hypothetical protein